MLSSFSHPPNEYIEFRDFPYIKLKSSQGFYRILYDDFQFNLPKMPKFYLSALAPCSAFYLLQIGRFSLFLRYN